MLPPLCLQSAALASCAQLILVAECVCCAPVRLRPSPCRSACRMLFCWIPSMALGTLATPARTTTTWRQALSMLGPAASPRNTKSRSLISPTSELPCLGHNTAAVHALACAFLSMGDQVRQPQQPTCLVLAQTTALQAAAWVPGRQLLRGVQASPQHVLLLVAAQLGGCGCSSLPPVSPQLVPGCTRGLPAASVWHNPGHCCCLQVFLHIVQQRQ